MRPAARVIKVGSGIVRELGGLLFQVRDSGSPASVGSGFRSLLSEFVRRTRRAGLIFVSLVASLVLYSLLVSPIGLLLWLIALPLSALASGLSLLWPSRRLRNAAAPDETVHDVRRLAARTGNHLASARRALPADALPVTRAIAGKLGEIERLPAELSRDVLLSHEAVRLIGLHLPNLLDSFLALPPAGRDAASEASQHLVEALAAVDARLDDIMAQIARSRHDRFDVHRRFIASRFAADQDLALG